MHPLVRAVRVVRAGAAVVAAVVAAAVVPPDVPAAAATLLRLVEAPAVHAVVLVQADVVPVAAAVVVAVVPLALAVPAALGEIAMRSKYISIFAILVVLALIGSGIYYFETVIIGRTPASYSSTNGVYDVLKADNTLFALGESLAAQGNFSDAQAAYEKAIPTVSDENQAGVVYLKLAIIQWSTDPVGSVASLEAIATNPQYANSTRAYALQYLGQAYDSPPVPLSTSQIQQLVNATFATSPFAAMLVDGDTHLAYRHIYDLADSLYPLPLPESRSASWYASQILASATSSISTSTKALYQSKIQANFTALDTAIQTESSDPSLNIFAAQALETKAGILTKFSYIGLAATADALTAHQRAIAEFDTITSQPFSDAFPRFYEAVFLAHASGSAQRANIQSVLAPIDTNAGYAASYFGDALKSASSDSTLHLHKQAVNVAAIDPKFKSFLISLGWSPTNFGS